MAGAASGPGREYHLHGIHYEPPSSLGATPVTTPTEAALKKATDPFFKIIQQTETFQSYFRANRIDLRSVSFHVDAHGASLGVESSMIPLDSLTSHGTLQDKRTIKTASEEMLIAVRNIFSQALGQPHSSPTTFPHAPVSPPASASSPPLQSEVEHLRSEVERYRGIERELFASQQARIDTLERHNALFEAFQDLRSREDLHREEMDRLQQALQESRAARQHAEAQVEALQHQLDELTSEADSLPPLAAETQRLRTANTLLQQQLDGSQAEVAQLRRANQDLTDQLRAAQARVGVLEDAAATHAASLQELAAARRDLATLQDQKTAVDAELRLATDRAALLDSRVTSQDRTIRELEAEVQQLSHFESQFTAAQREIERWKEENQRLEARATRAEARSAALNQQLDAQTSEMAALTDLTQQQVTSLAQMRQARVSLEDEAARLRPLTGQNAELQNQLHLKIAELAALDSRLADLEAALETNQSQLAAAQRATSEVQAQLDAARQENDALQSEKERLDEELRRKSSQVVSLEQRISNQEQIISDLQATVIRLAHFEDEVARLQEDVDSLREQNSALAEERTRLLAEARSSAAANAASERRMSELSTQIEANAQTIAAQRALISSLEAHHGQNMTLVTGLRDALAGAQASLSDEQRRVEAFSERQNDLQARFDQSQDEVGRLGSSIDQKEMANRRLLAEIQRLQGLMLTLVRDQGALGELEINVLGEVQKGSQTERLNRLAAYATRVGAELARLRDNLVTKTAESEALRGALSEAQRATTRAEEEVRHLRDELAAQTATTGAAIRELEGRSEALQQENVALSGEIAAAGAVSGEQLVTITANAAIISSNEAALAELRRALEEKSLALEDEKSQFERTRSELQATARRNDEIYRNLAAELDELRRQKTTDIIQLDESLSLAIQNKEALAAELESTQKRNKAETERLSAQISKLEEMLSINERGLRARDVKISHLEYALEAAHNLIRAQDNTLKEYKAGYQFHLALLRKRNAALEGRLEELEGVERELRETKFALANAETRIIEILARHNEDEENSAASLGRAETEIERLTVREKDLEAQLAGKNREIRALRDQMEEERENLTTGHRAAIEALQRAHASQMDVVHQANAGLIGDLRSKTKSIEALEVRLAALENELADKPKAEEISTLQAKIRTLEQDKAEQLDLILRQQKGNEALIAELSYTQERIAGIYSGQVSDLERLNHEQRSRLSHLEETLTELLERERDAKNDQHPAVMQLEDLRNHLEGTEFELANLTATIEARERTAKEKEALLAEKEARVLDLETTQSAILETLQKIGASSKGDLGHLLEDIGSRISAAETAAQESAQTLAQVKDDHAHELKDLEERLAQAVAEATASNTLFGLTSYRLTGAQSKLAHFRKLHNDDDLAIRKAESEITMLRKLTSAQEKTRDEQIARVETLEAALAKMRLQHAVEIEKLSSKNSVLKHEVEDLRAENLRLTNELANLRRLYNELRPSMQAAYDRLEKTTRDEFNLERQRLNLAHEQEVRRLQSAIAEGEKKHSDLNLEFVQLDIDFTEQGKLLDETLRELESMPRVPEIGVLAPEAAPLAVRTAITAAGVLEDLEMAIPTLEDREGPGTVFAAYQAEVAANSSEEATSLTLGTTEGYYRLCIDQWLCTGAIQVNIVGKEIIFTISKEVIEACKLNDSDSISCLSLNRDGSCKIKYPTEGKIGKEPFTRAPSHSLLLTLQTHYLNEIKSIIRKNLNATSAEALSKSIASFEIHCSELRNLYTVSSKSDTRRPEIKFLASFQDGGNSAICSKLTGIIACLSAAGKDIRFLTGIKILFSQIFSTITLTHEEFNPKTATSVTVKVRATARELTTRGARAGAGEGMGGGGGSGTPLASHRVSPMGASPRTQVPQKRKPTSPQGAPTTPPPAGESPLARPKISPMGGSRGGKGVPITETLPIQNPNSRPKGDSPGKP